MILLFASLLPVLIIGYYIYQKDKNKEPMQLLIKLFFAGVLSTTLTIIISGIIYALPIFSADQENLNLVELLFNVFIGIALVEEFSKWYMLYIFGYKNNKEFDEIYDMIVYGAFVALGFAGFENILYVMDGGMNTAIMRAFLSVPGHAFFGVYMGYYLGLAKISELNNNQELVRKNKIKSIIIPVLLHGTYDYLVMSGYFISLLIFIVFIILLYIYALGKVNKIAKISKKIIYKNNYCPYCGTRVSSEYCPTCGNKNE